LLNRISISIPFFAHNVDGEEDAEDDENSSSLSAALTTMVEQVHQVALLGNPTYAIQD
jgi:hypothetical protein